MHIVEKHFGENFKRLIEPAVYKLPVNSHAIISVSVDSNTHQDIVFTRDLKRVPSGLCQPRLKNLSINMARS